MTPESQRELGPGRLPIQASPIGLSAGDPGLGKNLFDPLCILGDNAGSIEQFADAKCEYDS